MGWVWQREGSWGAAKGVLSQRPSPGVSRAARAFQTMPQPAPGHSGHEVSWPSAPPVRREILH